MIIGSLLTSPVSRNNKFCYCKKRLFHTCITANYQCERRLTQQSRLVRTKYRTQRKLRYLLCLIFVRPPVWSEFNFGPKLFICFAVTESSDSPNPQNPWIISEKKGLFWRTGWCKVSLILPSKFIHVRLLNYHELYLRKKGYFGEQVDARFRRYFLQNFATSGCWTQPVTCSCRCRHLSMNWAGLSTRRNFTAHIYAHTHIYTAVCKNFEPLIYISRF